MLATENLAEQTAHANLEWLDQAWEAVDAAAWDEVDDQLQLLEDGVITFVAEVGEPFQVVLGLGGPDVRIVWEGEATQRARLVVRWGTERAERTGDSVSRTARYYKDMYNVD